MNWIAIMIGALTLLFLVGCASTEGSGSVDEDSGTGESDGGESAAELMDPPNDNHRLLQKLVGKWTLDMKMWMGPEATEHSVPCEWTSEMGGRYVRETYEMKDSAMDHKGILWIGYDNMRKKYRSVQFMSVSTMSNMYEGDYDAETKKLTMTTTWPMTWQGQSMEYTTQHIYHFESDDKINFTVMSKVKGAPGDFNKEVEGTFNRRK